MDTKIPSTLSDPELEQLEDFSDSCAEVCGAIKTAIDADLKFLRSEAKAFPSFFDDFNPQPLLEESANNVGDRLNALVLRKQRLSDSIQMSLVMDNIRKGKVKNPKKEASDRYKKVKESFEKAKKELEAIEKETNETLYTLVLLKVNANTQKLTDLDGEIRNYINGIRLEDHLDKEEFITARAPFKVTFDNITKSMNTVSTVEASKLTMTYVEKYNTYLKETYEKQLTAALEQLNSLFSVQLDYYTKPMDFDGQNIDVIQLKLTETPKADGNAQSTEYDYNIWVKGGFKIDVSAGAFLSTLENQQFEIGMDGDARVINQVNVGRHEYGFGSVANLSYRTGAWVKPTLSFGAMFTTDTQFQFLVGGGLILGKMNRFVFHYGLSVGRVDRLKDQFTPNEEGQIVLEDANLGRLPKKAASFFLYEDLDLC